ncbi:transcription factor collier [Trichonephila inaurata madagascariensis]|uniref:Transcription factor collier n=1 Tax=Trichonephila inaurata madagascariensis TaxID=2747483 RepID=A0A8X6I841_9ARAC|nr:transcription factor collier [Trichonephila inaurata madagascariensis]
MMFGLQDSGLQPRGPMATLKEEPLTSAQLGSVRTGWMQPAMIDQTAGSVGLGGQILKKPRQPQKNNFFPFLFTRKKTGQPVEVERTAFVGFVEKEQIEYLKCSECFAITTSKILSELITRPYHVVQFEF